MGQSSRAAFKSAVSIDRPSDLAVWWQAIRPATLLASVPPALVASALAYRQGHFRAPLAALFLLTFALLQITSNLVNDAADFATGADGADRVGPARMAQKGWLTQRALVTGSALTLTLALLGIVVLARVAGPRVWIGGLLSVFGAIGYTAGPVRFGYLGFGDLMVFFYFGLVALAGHYYVQTGGLDMRIAWACLAIGFHATAILVVNNLRDRVSDERVGKRTLVVRFGDRFGRFEYGALVLVPYAVVLLTPLGAGAFAPLPWLSLLWAVRLVRRVRVTHGAPLNPLLGETARLGLVFSVLLAASLILKAWFPNFSMLGIA